MVKILLVGDDFRLLATRAAVLAKIGANTVCCSVVEMMRGFGRETFDLILFCHSLSKEEASAAMVLARAWWPEAKVLILMSNYQRENGELPGFDKIISSEPSQLVHEIGSILRELPAPR